MAPAAGKSTLTSLMGVAVAFAIYQLRQPPACVGSGAYCGQPPALESNASSGAREYSTSTLRVLSAAEMQQYTSMTDS